MYWIHRSIRKGLLSMRAAPRLLLWGASTVMWAYGTRCLGAWRIGFRQGLAFADRFLERYPRVQREYREMIRAADPAGEDRDDEPRR